MPTPVIMPKYEMAQETGTVIEWLKKEGESVEKGEPILIVGTDKVEMEVEAPADGILRGISAQPGDVIPIGQTIAYIVAPGEEWVPPTEQKASERPVSPPPPSVRGETRVRATPVAERMAREHGLDLAQIQGSGPEGRITRADVEAALAAQRSAPPPPSPVGRVPATPAARRLARELGVDLAQVQGTGPGGRVQAADVRRAVAERREEGPTEGALIAIRRRVPLSGLRRTIAERMVQSAREAPQFTISMDVDMTRSLDALAHIRSRVEQEGQGPRITQTAWLVKACAWALQRHPAINASFAENEIVEWADVNIGVAVAVDDGLVVPVIHQADRLTLTEIAERLRDLSTRAREGSLRLEDIRGGTFTISNLGMFGVDRFTALLNPPQAVILAVGRILPRPVVTEEGDIVARPVMSMTASADHRVVDGAQVARFLADVREVLEHPALLLA